MENDFHHYQHLLTHVNRPQLLLLPITIADF